MSNTTDVQCPLILKLIEEEYGQISMRTQEELPPLNDSAREQKRSPVEPEDDAKLSGTAGSNSIDGLHYTPVPKASCSPADVYAFFILLFLSPFGLVVWLFVLVLQLPPLFILVLYHGCCITTRPRERIRRTYCCCCCGLPIGFLRLVSLPLLLISILWLGCVYAVNFIFSAPFALCCRSKKDLEESWEAIMPYTGTPGGVEGYPVYQPSDRFAHMFTEWYKMEDIFVAFLGAIDRQGFCEFLIAVPSMIVTVPIMKHVLHTNYRLFNLRDVYINQWSDPLDGNGDRKELFQLIKEEGNHQRVLKSHVETLACHPPAHWNDRHKQMLLQANAILADFQNKSTNPKQWTRTMPLPIAISVSNSTVLSPTDLTFGNPPLPCPDLPAVQEPASMPLKSSAGVAAPMNRKSLTALGVQYNYSTRHAMLTHTCHTHFIPGFLPRSKTASRGLIGVYLQAWNSFHPIIGYVEVNTRIDGGVEHPMWIVLDVDSYWATQFIHALNTIFAELGRRFAIYLSKQEEFMTKEDLQDVV
ncbi:hypothetical protein AAMO2058_000028000 [Amorphochlora amoebiformis]